MITFGKKSNLYISFCRQIKKLWMNKKSEPKSQSKGSQNNQIPFDLKLAMKSSGKEKTGGKMVVSSRNGLVLVL